jgi:hypothetical protein
MATKFETLNAGGCPPESIRARIDEAMRGLKQCDDEVRASTLRLIHCAVRDRDIEAQSADRRDGCADAEIRAILTKMVEQREKSITRYESAGQAAQAERERVEIEVISEFLPQLPSDDVIKSTAEEVVDELNASGLKDIGRCMGEMKTRLDGRFDACKANKAVKDLLR